MKVAYIAPINNTGYGQSAISHILSLDSIGIDVVCRHVEMTKGRGEVPERIKELESKDLNNVDVVIQHNLPSEFVYKGGIQNIGMFCYETTNFKNSGWRNNILLMDKIVVPCNFQADSVVKTCGEDIEDKISVLWHPVDAAKFDKDYDKMSFETTDSTIKFYSISEINARKNLAGLLLAYYTAFSCYDDVLLVLKVHLSGGNSDASYAHVKRLCDEIKSTSRRFSNEKMYPRVAVISDFLTNDQMCSLHQSCNIFVTASKGESICLPYLDALGFGNPAIAPLHTSFIDYGEYEFLVDAVETPVFGVNDSLPNLYTGDEVWFNPSIIELAKRMRHVKDNISQYSSPHQKLQRMNAIKNGLSYKVVGEKFKEIINAM